MTNKTFFGIGFIALVAGFIWFSPPLTGQQTTPNTTNATYTMGNIELITGVNKQLLKVEIADTPKAWEQGLMFRSEWGDIEGMLFMFHKERSLNFWMKNTELPLDILFFDASGNIANIARNTTPMSLEQIPSLLPTTYVLEIPAGKSDALGLDDSTTLSIDALHQEAP